MKYISLTLLIIFGACMQKIKIPDASKTPHKMTIHGDTRVDNYYWMRLTDKQKSTKKYDNQTKEVVD